MIFKIKAISPLYNKEVKSYIKNKIEAELDQIHPVAGKCMYNYKCHMNSAHEAVVNGEDFVLLGFYMWGDQPIIHFYNYTNGQVVDNTLGVHTLNFKHYLYKRVPKEDFNRIDDVFGDFRDHIQNNLPFKLRVLSNYIP